MKFEDSDVWKKTARLIAYSLILCNLSSRRKADTGLLLTIQNRMVYDKSINHLNNEEGHLEYFLFGCSNKDIIRKMPCSILLVKKEPGSVAF